MNKILTFTLLAFGLLVVGTKVYSVGNSDAWEYKEVAASSATLFNGSGWLKAISLSSATPTNDLKNFAVALDSYSADTSNAPYSSFISSQKKSQALLFKSTITVNGYSTFENYIEYPGDGVRIYNGLFIYKTTDSSGEAHKVGVLFRR